MISQAAVAWCRRQQLLAGSEEIAVPILISGAIIHNIPDKQHKIRPVPLHLPEYPPVDFAFCRIEPAIPSRLTRYREGEGLQLPPCCLERIHLRRRLPMLAAGIHLVKIGGPRLQIADCQLVNGHFVIAAC